MIDTQHLDRLLISENKKALIKALLKLTPEAQLLRDDMELTIQGIKINKQKLNAITTNVLKVRWYQLPRPSAKRVRRAYRPEFKQIQMNVRASKPVGCTNTFYQITRTLDRRWPPTKTSQ